MSYRQISNIEQLDKLIEEHGVVECFVSLGGGGVLRSSKVIQKINQDTYNVLNEIDDTEEDLTLDELKSSIIWEAMTIGSFYQYD